MPCPRGGSKISNESEFKTRVGKCSHIAVRRPFLGIYHHYLVIKKYSNAIDIKHNVGGISKSLASFGFAEIQKETIFFEHKSEHLDFKAGVYLIERPGYPYSERRQSEVISRAMSRLGEKQYKFSSNNCEWFVTWAMTGNGSCEQIDNAGIASRFAADFADSTVCNYRSATAKAVVDKGIQGACIKGVEKVVASNVLKGSSRLSAAAASSSIVTGTFAAAATIPIEAITSIASIDSLQDSYNDGQINQRTFEREVTKRVSGSVASVSGSIGGAVIGQMLIPVPIVGGIVGGTVGSLFGRIAGSVLSGAMFDLADSDSD